LQPERAWTLAELARTLTAPTSSVHRELERAEDAGIVVRDASARPHRFQAAVEDPIHEPLRELLGRTIGVEAQLRQALQRPDVDAAVIHGSWATGVRRPGSDIDVLAIGPADLRELRRRVRPVGKSAGRTIDLTVLTPEEFRRMVKAQTSFARTVLEQPTLPIVGDLRSVVIRD
jgi:predicted nucleotidyltransferase